MKDPKQGYDPLLAERMQAVLPDCRAKGIRIITNMGAANPVAAAEMVREIARSLGLSGIRIAAVAGDDVTETVRAGDQEGYIRINLRGREAQGIVAPGAEAEAL